MAGTKGKKWGWIILAMLLVLVVGGAVGYRVAVGTLRDKVVEALGPGSEIEDIQVGWSGVVVRGLRLKGPQGWPAQDALRTQQVTIVPSLLDLLAGEIRVRSVTIEKPYLSALRAKDGKFRIVPTLLERQAATGEGKTRFAAPPVYIATITLRDGVVEFFDATVAKPTLKLRLEQLQASVRNALVPALTGKSDFDLTGTLRGVRQDGRIKVEGWVEGATRESAVKTELRGVDLVAVQPYLSTAADVRVQRGLLDLDLQTEVRKNRLRAPGRLSIAGLELAPSQGMMGTFMGVPRGAVLAFLKDKDNRIAMDFIIEGDINNPKFSLNEALSVRVASSMAKTLGVSIQGVAEGVGMLGRKGADVMGGTAKGIGDAIGGLFGARKK
jgi:hypothetical protein